MTNYIEKCNYFKDTISNFSIILYLNLDAYNFKTAYAIAKNIKEFHYEKQYLTDKMPDDDVEQNLDAIIDELSSDNPNDIEDIKEQVKNMTEFMETPSKTQKKRGRKKKISL